MLILLLLAVLLLGLGDSIVGPYLVLFGANAVHLSALQIGVLSSVTAVSGMVVSTWLARRYDRRPARWPALISVFGPAVGYLLLTVTRSYVLLLIIAATLLGAGLAGFPQVFALAKARLDDSGGAGPPGTARRRLRTGGTPMLRSTWSLAWAIGPLIGAVTLATFGFPGVFVVSALLFAAVALPLAGIGRSRPAPAPGEASAADGPGLPRRVKALLLAGCTLFFTAMLAGSVVLPLFVTQTLKQPESDVGVLFSVCAAVEIPVGPALMWLPARARKDWWIVGGMALLAVYFGLVTFASGNGMVIAAQAARAGAIAVVAAVGIAYFQDLMPNATGRATTLFANTLTAGSLISGVLAGGVAQWLGYRAAQGLCGVLAVLGALCVLIGARGYSISTATSSASPEAQPATATAT
jgi:MFS transporter, SET family, sugar efflux transporter